MSNRIIVVLLVLVLGFLAKIDLQQSSLNERVAIIESVIIDSGQKIQYTKEDEECLARNIYYEAGIESDEGKFAIAHVTLNRLHSKFWGDSVCKVVYSKAQFSWTLQRRLPRPDAELYKRCQYIAHASLNGKRVRGLEKSLFYHADYIKTPNWADNQNLALKIGQHIFYNRAKNSWLEI
jgi:spore germination cell wall hydrolase CwlJ-like protein